MVESSVSMAVSDFYAINSHYTTRLSLSLRDSHGDPLVALASAIDLLQNEGVEAIIGGSSLLETKLLAEIGEKARVPVISLNSPISSSLSKYSHLVQATHDSASEAKVGFTVSSSDGFVLDQLQKLKDMGATVFVVHLSQRIATPLLFPCAVKLEMMGEGFAWILTAKTINSFHENIDDFLKEAMEGVVGFKSYIPMSKELHNFTLRWRKSLPLEENVGTEITRLSISGVWAHDIAWALARAVEVIARMPNGSSTLLEEITEIRFKGLGGDFQLDDNKLLSHKIEIVNMVGSGESKRKKLRVLVTSSNRFPSLIKVETDRETNKTTAEGFCIDVFLASIRPFNYEVEYITWRNGSDYDILASALYTQKDKYDAAVGDITISPKRSMYVDFTMPFTEMGLGIVAPKETIWLIERSENTEFQGSWSQQIGVMLWFGFSTLVYAHRERLKHNLSRFVVTVWIFAVLILTTSYNATLTSMMTMQQIRFNSNKGYVSLIADVSLTYSSGRNKGLNTSEDFAQALLNKTVTHVVNEIPYLKVLLGEHPADFLMVRTQHTTNGFGFMFQKGHELVSDVSREISRLRTSESLNEMEKRWFNKKLPYTSDDTSDPITLYRFRGLFFVSTGHSLAPRQMESSCEFGQNIPLATTQTFQDPPRRNHPSQSHHR
ncbi:hypothetical protein AALP_AA5G171500 [Arabis alpina]|uniref:Ionotropic glutamate receptor C-terminal domain-containing protein n=1 Tax=Arabis alpina TaxID=50452 RepID=A0A087GXN2_ARAAL|nr:hypothetical protein AALP_AA5G171500 [Arabis alpina]